MSKKQGGKDVVAADNDWINHIMSEDPKLPASFKMFTSESYYKGFWDNAQHGVLLADIEGNIIEANPYFVEMMETTDAELERKNIKDIIPDRAWKIAYANFTTMINGKRYQSVEETEVKVLDTKKEIAVRVVSTRVPSTLYYPFQHVILHFYELKPLTDFNNVVKDLSWTGILKSLLVEKTGMIAFLTFSIFIILAITGNLEIIMQLLKSFGIGG